MRKKLKKLDIRRETLGSLDGRELVEAQGRGFTLDPKPGETGTSLPDTRCSNCTGTRPCCIQGG